MNIELIKLGIGLPVTDRRFDKDFGLSFAICLASTVAEGISCTLLTPTQEIYDHAENIAIIRNSLVAQAKENDCTHLIMMDTDQVYHPNTIIKMLAHDVDVVGALVHRRYPPFAPILYRGELSKYKYVSYEEMYSGDLVEVDATGCGCILYTMDIFKALPSPWFEKQIGKNGKPIGEDIGFCSRLRSVDYKIFVDTSIQLDHLTTFRVNRGTYDLFRKIYAPVEQGNLKETGE